MRRLIDLAMLFALYRRLAHDMAVWGELSERRNRRVANGTGVEFRSILGRARLWRIAAFATISSFVFASDDSRLCLHRFEAMWLIPPCGHQCRLDRQV